MYRIGLTGGIASGKSAVSRHFETLGIDVIDTDLISRELTSPDSTILERITETFGSAMLNPDGSLDRQALRQLIFDQPDKRQQLEAILHPAIRARAVELAAKAKSPFCVIVIPLLFETDYPYELDRILVVDSERELQISRLMQRDSISQEDAEKILAVQLDNTERLAQADDVIRNVGSIDQLASRVEALHRQYLDQAKEQREFTSTGE